MFKVSKTKSSPRIVTVLLKHKKPVYSLPVSLPRSVPKFLFDSLSIIIFSSGIFYATDIIKLTLFIIKFRYNAQSGRLKKCALIEGIK